MAHPRLRGEHHYLRVFEQVGVGSSPLARGTPTRSSGAASRGGLIPACAGNTLKPSTGLARWRAHPRLRGEHCAVCGCGEDWHGSSPLTRGTLEIIAVRTDGVGLIPACAGNTGRSWLLLQAEGAHPRLRGEHMPGVSGTGYDGGSSPLARGTHLMYIGEGEAVGLIPACAGNTGIWNQPHARAGAHPRLRGEHNDADCRASIGGGSSPLARGTPRPGCRKVSPYRLIPACAGNTVPGVAGDWVDEAHPRLRGEHTSRAAKTRAEYL